MPYAAAAAAATWSGAATPNGTGMGRTWACGAGGGCCGTKWFMGGKREEESVWTGLRWGCASQEAVGVERVRVRQKRRRGRQRAYRAV